MYYRQFTARSVFAGLLVISAGTLPATAEEELHVSAANCIPRHAGQFEGNGVEGFKWDDAGIFLNGDVEDNQDLICAVPYDPLLRIDGRRPSLEVKVDVFDGHDSNEEIARDAFRLTEEHVGKEHVRADNLLLPELGNAGGRLTAQKVPEGILSELTALFVCVSFLKGHNHPGYRKLVAEVQAILAQQASAHVLIIPAPFPNG
jgi:hypothetical protein